MLRVTLELVPGGDEERRQTLDVFTIGNQTGAGDAARADYVAVQQLAQPHHRVEWLKLHDWPRKKFDAWDLVIAVLLCGLRTTRRDELLEELRRRGLA